MSLVDKLSDAAEQAAAHLPENAAVSGALATEHTPGLRVYLCSVDTADGFRHWLAVRKDGSTVADRAELRAAVSIAALCEVAEDVAGGGSLDELVRRLEELRDAEPEQDVSAAIAAARALRAVIGEPPQVATPERLDSIGAATRELERELDPGGASPFTAAMRSAQGAVSELQREVEGGYLIPLT